MMSEQASGSGPPTQQGYVVAQRTSGAAIASLICGIGSLIACPVLAIPGIITGYVARRSIKESGGAESGNGMALAGIICSVVSLILSLVVVGVFFLFLRDDAPSKAS